MDAEAYDTITDALCNAQARGDQYRNRCLALLEQLRWEREYRKAAEYAAAFYRAQALAPARACDAGTGQG